MMVNVRTAMQTDDIRWEQQIPVEILEVFIHDFFRPELEGGDGSL